MEENNIDGDCWVYFAGQDVTSANIQDLEDRKGDMPFTVFHTREE